ncbi:CD226 antigen isoform X2 [Clupea harengus]|uniref:CD226 antigen isoform X2 n=1 Tax=Clupea harengus TaxID=7950 RepID=A0A6P8GZ16_CLUHA|nr:CD226 antigen isoform X2 [Clupea harengus]
MQTGSTGWLEPCQSSVNAVFILAEKAEMEAVQKDYWYSLALLTFLIFSLFKATVQESADEAVTLEDGMILDCQCPWDGNLSMVSWTKVPDKVPIAVHHPRYGTKLAEGYDNRLEFLKRTSMDGSISMTNVTEQDVGLYRCSMQTFPLGSWTRDVQVQKANSSPYFVVALKEGENVTLVCPQASSTVKHVLIKKAEEGTTLGSCRLKGGVLVSDAEHHDEGVRVDCAAPIGVIFELYNVVEADEGRYWCWSDTENGLEIATFQLILHTQDALHTPTSDPEEAAVSSSSSTLQPEQVLEDPDPADGIPMTELPSSDAANGVSYPSAPSERILTTDSASSATTKSVPDPPAEGISNTKLASVVATTTLPHPLASTEGVSTTEMAPSVKDTIVSPSAPSEGKATTESALSVVATTESAPSVVATTESAPSVVATTESAPSVVATTETAPSFVATTESAPSVVATIVPHPPDPALTEGTSSSKLAPAVIATTVLHLPAPSEGIATTESAPSVIATTLPHPPGQTEGTSTTESAPSVIATTDPHPPDSAEEISTTESAPSVVATTVPHPPEPSEDMSTTDLSLSVKATTVPQSSDEVNNQLIPDEYWIYIYSGAGATGLSLLVLITVLVCCHRRRKRREAYRVKLHPGKRWRDSEQGGFYDRMRKGTRFGRHEPIYANVRTGQKHKHKPKRKR